MITTLLDDRRAQGDRSPGGALDDLFFRSRSVVISGEINDRVAARAVTHLLALAEDSDNPINLYISSPGGHVESGDMVHDVIRFIRPRVRAIGSGWVSSAGALIFVGADRQDRYCLPNTRFLLHQPAGGIGGTASDMAIQARQIEIMRDRFHHLFAAATGQTPERIARDTRRDFWLTTAEALDYGLVGQVISSVDELK
jgi:ATP-dependent Clp protease protease subunit